MPKEVKLPPPGDARREELKRRTDALEQEAEETGLEGGTGPLPEVENELAQHFNELEVSNQDPAYVYAWVNSGFYTRFVKMKLADGWEVVQGDMPEAEELKGVGADTTRRLGDVILMRIRRDRYLMLQRRERELRQRQQEGVTGTLQEMGDRYRQHGIVVHTGETMNPRVMETMQKRATARRAGGQQFDQMLREGRVPGRPAPGV